MKNYIIGVMAVAILFLGSLLYKDGVTMVPKKFPVVAEGADVEVPLVLYLFFSKKNCHDCLDFIEVLNVLPDHFVVRGIVPAHELEDEKELREITGATFPLLHPGKFKKYAPWYSPTLVGVAPSDGRVLFQLPGVPGEKAYLKGFLDTVYLKLYPIFLQDLSGH